jgi:transcriptional regulator with XRE-family HTH domain
MSFRKIVLAEVKRQRLSGYRLARMCGVPERTVQKYLSGGQDLTGEKLCKLTDALGLELRPRRRRRK